MPSKDDILKQLTDLVDQGSAYVNSFRFGDMGVIQSDVPETDLRAFAITAIATISRIAGDSSQYFRLLPSIGENDPLGVPGYTNTKVPSIVGSLKALRNAVASGLLESLESRLRANIHSDFLVQAEVLLAAGYHVAAMVLWEGLSRTTYKKCAYAVV